MWLLTILSTISRLAGRIYYRLTYSGGRVPKTGPVLLVANHPNSLFDPALVIAAAHRKVRFLGKAPLFTDPLVGWLVRGAGAIPVYRRQDDPTQTAKNEDMFRAVHTVLAEGSAVAIFPEGISHNEPGLTTLKTGAARIALGAAAKSGNPFPIIPVGLVFRQKDVFRSEAQVIVGEPVDWADLANKGVEDTNAVRKLTSRIDEALRTVTVNLDAWEDKPIVECALEVWETAKGDTKDPAAMVTRLKVATSLLRGARDAEAPEHRSLIDAVRTHAERLEHLGLTPSDLSRNTTAAAAIRWSAKRIFLASIPSVVTAVVGYVLFWIPYRITGLITDLMPAMLDQRSINKLLVGIVVYGIWVVGLAVGGGFLFTPVAAPLLFFAVPIVGMIGLLVRERWSGAWSDARSFILLKSRRDLIDELRNTQDTLAEQLHQFLNRR